MAIGGSAAVIIATQDLKEISSTSNIGDFLKGIAFSTTLSVAGLLLINLSLGQFLDALRAAVNWRCQYPPDARISCWLLDILGDLDESSTKWADLQLKLKQVNRLERIAKTLETDLWKVLRSGDTATDSWLRSAMVDMAASVRLMKRAILTPREDSRHWLEVRISTDLYHLVDGQWDSLRHHDELQTVDWARPPRHEVFRDAIARGVSLLTAGLAPVCALTLVQRTQQLNEPMATWLPIATYSVAALTFLVVLDPLFGLKVSYVKDLKGLLKIVSTDGEKANKNGQDDLSVAR